jgi:hypothetical protein
MSFNQKTVAIVVSLFVLVLIIDLVRKRKLREEYSVLWILTGIGIVVLASWYGLLKKITTLIGAVLPTSTLFFFALIFLILLSLQFSVRISSLQNQMKELTQRMALLEVDEPKNLPDRKDGEDEERTPNPP